MKKTLLYWSCLLLILAVSCKSKDKYRKAADEILDNIPAPKNMNVGKENYSLYVPEGWTTRYQTEKGIDIYFLLAPKTKDDPNTNISVITGYMYNLGLEEYIEKSIESLKKYVPSAIILNKGNIEANGIKGGWYSYTMEVSGIGASLVCYIFPKNRNAYSITGGTQLEDAYRYRNTFDSVARSLRFKE